MQAITKSDLRREIHEILKDADLSEITASKVRQQLEKKFKVELITLRSKIDALVMEFVNSQCDDSSDESEADDDKKDIKEEDEKSEEETKKLKRPASSRKPAKKSRDSSNDSESDSDEDDAKPAKKTKADAKKEKNDSDSDSDREVKKKKKAAPKKTAGKGKGNGFTRTYTLSPELAKLMGCESLPRHEVVKKVWQIIKERNLYDPKNKQYAICDSELLTVIGVKRFRSFGMLKYLRNHFID